MGLPESEKQNCEVISNPIWKHLVSRWSVPTLYAACSSIMRHRFCIIWATCTICAWAHRWTDISNKGTTRDLSSTELLTPQAKSERRQDGNEQKWQPRKRSKGALKIQLQQQATFTSPYWIEKASDKILTISQHMSSDISIPLIWLPMIIHRNLPGLTHIGLTSPQDANNPYCQDQETSHHASDTSTRAKTRIQETAAIRSTKATISSEIFSSKAERQGSAKTMDLI